MRRLLLAVLLFAPVCAGAQTIPWGLDALMQQMAHVKKATASFTAQKTSPLLTTPLSARGVLVYRAPYYMRKTTLSPVHEVFILDHDRITMSGGPGGQTQRFSTSDAPQIAGLVTGIRAVLAGDTATLTRLYSVGLRGTEGTWQLRLVPLDARTRKIVKSITIAGSDDRVTGIDTLAPSGGLTRMHVTETITTDAH